MNAGAFCAKQGTCKLWQNHINIAAREESTDLRVQNSWCIELLVHTIIPPTCKKNNKGVPSVRPTGARSTPVDAFGVKSDDSVAGSGFRGGFG